MDPGVALGGGRYHERQDVAGPDRSRSLGCAAFSNSVWVYWMAHACTGECVSPIVVVAHHLLVARLAQSIGVKQAMAYEEELLAFLREEVHQGRLGSYKTELPRILSEIHNPTYQLVCKGGSSARPAASSVMAPPPTGRPVPSNSPPRSAPATSFQVCLKHDVRSGSVCKTRGNTCPSVHVHTSIASQADRCDKELADFNRRKGAPGNVEVKDKPRPWEQAKGGDKGKGGNRGRSRANK